MVVRSEGHVAVIDTGRDPALMTACLDTLGIGRIELLVLTHYDLDHVGGTSAVVGRVDRAIVGPGLDAGDAGIVRMLVAGGADVAQVSRGPTGILGDLRWRVLWPPTRLGDIEPGNPASVTVEFEPVGTCANGCLSSLFLGDLGESPQDRLLAANPTLGHVDVVKVAHHGSADQSVRLYERVSAVVGLIGVGLHNGYGHPTAKLLGILASTRTAVARTDLQGLVLLAPGEHQGEVTVWSERSGVGGDG
jgi:competence protein ComEC